VPTNRPIKVSQGTVKKAKTEFYGQLEVYLRDIVTQLNKSYPDEFRLLKAVVEGDNTEITEFGREAPDLIDHLIGYGLVERVGEEFDIRFNAIKVVLKRLIVKERGEDRWAELSRRRNALETEIRTTLYRWSRGLPKQKWESILHRSLTKRRLAELKSTEPGILFSRKESPLYFTDLLMMLKDEETLPFIADRRHHIVRQMNAINSARKDAHAITVNDAEIAAARSAFDYLEGEFNAP